jgi:hypothetical protein
MYEVAMALDVFSGLQSGTRERKRPPYMTLYYEVLLAPADAVFDIKK